MPGSITGFTNIPDKNRNAMISPWETLLRHSTYTVHASQSTHVRIGVVIEGVDVGPAQVIREMETRRQKTARREGVPNIIRWFRGNKQADEAMTGSLSTLNRRRRGDGMVDG